MARQRRYPNSSRIDQDENNGLTYNDFHSNKGHFKSKSRGVVRRSKYTEQNYSLLPKLFYFVIAGSVILGAGYFMYLGYIETRVNTPLPFPKVVLHSGLEVPDRYWGTYRSGLYFGTSVRHPKSILTGLMWFVPGHFQDGRLAVRHWCSQADGLEKYGWLMHDGRNFGSQKLVDKYVVLSTDFIKQPGGDHGGDWSARIKMKSKTSHGIGKLASIIYYVALHPDDEKGSLDRIASSETLGSLTGYSESIGNFQFHFINSRGTISMVHYLNTRYLGLDLLQETVMKGMRFYSHEPKEESYYGLIGDSFDGGKSGDRPNFIAFQITGVLPFEVDVVFESGSLLDRNTMLTGDIFTNILSQYTSNFDAEFEQVFQLRAKNYSSYDIQFAKGALSNMIGGIGYFFGASKVQGEYNNDPVPYWKTSLYTGVPSRSFFPRGFLWDEGFHNLLISKWDREISMDIIAHWFDLMNWDGWIPREQILGVEAAARVPDEFIVQSAKNANPPTLLLTLHSMLASFKYDIADEDFNYLSRLWPRLKSWYNWFNNTQFGEVPGTYRWRGRNADSVRELNPKTLTSGLDDYPRPSHPTVHERHIDLLCWMILSSSLMADFAKIVEKDPTRYEETYKFLSDNTRLNSLHWSYISNGYMDYGLHTDDAELKQLKPDSEKVRVVYSDPRYRFVDSFGYVSFFPLFLQIIDSYSPNLAKIIEDLRKPDLLWTPFGLRSLARTSPFYNKHNTQHDPPYWRGSIWINMNFLAVRALHYYSTVGGPFQLHAKEVYEELRKNVINNVIKEYRRTGFLWEHYNDKTGRGEGCHPFTGWSALVVLMMGETY